VITELRELGEGYFLLRTVRVLRSYFVNLKGGKLILWCYLLWYLSNVYMCFDGSPKIWVNALGISAIIGLGLMLSVGRSADPWQNFRLFLMPFCVSSFSALIKGRDYLFVFSPVPRELLTAIGCCLIFVAFIMLLKYCYRPDNIVPESPEK